MKDKISFKLNEDKTVIPSSSENQSESIPPITKELSGIAQMDIKISDKELLYEALKKRFL